MYNSAAYNPAFNNFSTSLMLSLLTKARWLGVEGSPKIQLFSANYATSFHSSFGSNIKYKSVGFSSETEWDISYSYTIRADDFSTVSFGLGLKALFNQVSLDKSRAFGIDPQVENIINGITPNVSFGVYYQTNDLFISFSLPYIFERAYLNGFNIEIDGNRRIYSSLGYVYETRKGLKIKPAILVDASKSEGINLSSSINFLYKEKVALGLSYLFNNYTAWLAMYKISDKFHLGISNEFDLTNISNYSNKFANFEFFLQIKIPNRLVRYQVISPNF